VSKGRSVGIRLALGAVLSAVLAVPLVAGAEQPAESVESAQPEPDAPESTPVTAATPVGNLVLLYKLSVGKPRARIGGGRRGAEDPLPQLIALVPNHVGLTTSAQPALYWSVSGPAPVGDMYFEFAITDEDSIEPLAETRLASPGEAGIQEILLEGGAAQLEPGVEYRWSVTLVVDPAGPSTRDPVAGGWIERVSAPADLDARLSAAGPEGAPAIYADLGLWYDALAPLASRTIRDPQDAIARRHLAGLLRQVDLDGVAADVAQREPN
jgi:hypothetical protein